LNRDLEEEHNTRNLLLVFFFCGAKAQLWPRSLHCWAL